MRAGPFGRLRFLYVGSTKFDEDLRYYTEGFGADVVWDVTAGGARVAALRVSDGLLLLLADHRPARSCLPIYETEDLTSTVKSLRARGFRPSSRRFEIPNGPCQLFEDRTGNEFALFEDVRPDAMERAHADPENRRAVRARAGARR